MTSSVEYSSYIIDLCSAMLDNRQGLTDAQVKRLTMIHRESVNFITEYLRHESSSLPELLDFLGHSAIAPLQAIVGYSDMILSGRCGRLRRAYGEAISEIRDCTYAIYDDVQDMHENLQELMQNLEMVS